MDPALAKVEARTAAESFAWLGANTELDRATAMLRALGGPARTGVRRVGSLTDREEEVLALVSQGLSNPQIAERLYISRKTASHHVSNVLSQARGAEPRGGGRVGSDPRPDPGSVTRDGAAGRQTTGSFQLAFQVTPLW